MPEVKQFDRPLDIIDQPAIMPNEVARPSQEPRLNAFAALLEQLNATTEAMNRVATALESKQLESPFMNERSAAIYLGLNVDQKNYPRKMRWLIRQGFLTKYHGKQERVYDRQDVIQCASKLAETAVVIGQV